MRRGPSFGSEFFAPWPLLAVALMVLNDRVLKPWLHNAITGKLSDLAICFFLPLFTSALLGIVWKRRPRLRIVVATAIAGLVFAAQEVWPGFADVFLVGLRAVGEPLGLRRFVLTSDPTDLLALIMLPLAVVYGFRRVARPTSRAGQSATSVPGSGRGAGG